MEIKVRNIKVYPLLAEDLKMETAMPDGGINDV